MRTNEQIFESVKNNGFISESDLKLLKNRSNKEGRDLFNYDVLEAVNDGYGVPLTEDQGIKGLAWLKKFIRRDGTSRCLGAREISIIKDSEPGDFLFVGFWDAGNGFFKNYLPMYRLGGMEYIPKAEPYVIG